MPFDTSSPLPSFGTVGIGEYDRPEPSYVETIGAWLQDEGMIGSALADAKRGVDFNRIDPGYNVFDHIDGYENEAMEGAFDDVLSAEAEAAVKSNIDRKRENQRVRDASGWVATGLGFAATMATDPTMLLPGGALYRTGKIGYNAARSALSVGVASGGASAVSEAFLQTSQETRSATESALNIGGSAILGGVLGAAGARLLSAGEWSSLSKNLTAELDGQVVSPGEVANTIVTRMQSAGAAAVDGIKLDDLGVGGPAAAKAVANATAALRINPGLEVMTSPATSSRRILGELIDNPIYSQMNMEGRTLGADVENLVKLTERGSLSSWLRSSRDLYRQAKKDGFTGSRTEFNEAVARAGRRGDIDPSGNEYISRLAREAREKIFDPLLERAKQLGMLPEDVKVTTAASYVTRLWNRTRLIAQEVRFREIANEYFHKELAKLPDDMKVDFVSKADLDDYIDEAVTSVFNNLTGRGVGDVPEWLVPLARGPLKERTFNIPDELIEEFLENDMELILRRYTRTMGAEVELTQKFGRSDMKEQFEEINREYADLSKAAKTEDERLTLEKRRSRDIRNLQAFRDMIRGTYRTGDESSNWSKLTRAALTWNYIRLLGGVTVSSLLDAGRILGVHGVRATMREALPALVSNVRAVKIARQDARDLGVVADTILQSRLATLADLQDPYRYGSNYERFLSNSSNVFSKATGLSYWNDTMRTVASVMTQNRMAKNAMNMAGAGKRERAYMAYLGIDDNMAGLISKQIEKYGQNEKGIWGVNVSEWDDVAAARAWGAALSKDVDRTIIMKGVADTPLWTKTNWGRLITQFKSFGLASHQRVLIAGLQERPHRLAENLVFGTALGMMVAYLKYIERGDFDEADRLFDNPGLWIADGLDRTGLLSLPFEFSNTADKVYQSSGGQGGIGITAAAQGLAGDPDRGGATSRYASRGALSAVAGPWAGIFEDLSTIASQVGQGDLKKSGANAIIRQIPGATLPGARSGIHYFVKPALQEAVD